MKTATSSANVKRALSLLMCGLLVWPLSAWATWKWVDKNGMTQYTDLPPPADTPEDKILKRGDVGKGPAANEKNAPSLIKQIEEKQKRDEEAKKAAELAKKNMQETENAKIREKNCKTANTVLATINSGSRIASVNDKGEKIILDDQQVAERKNEALDAISKNCSN